MADTKTSALAAVTTPADADVVPIVNAGVTKSISLSALTAYFESRARQNNASVAQQARPHCRNPADGLVRRMPPTERGRCRLLHPRARRRTSIVAIPGVPTVRGDAVSRVWRKGCMCGCLIEEECRYYEPPAQRVEHVHFHVVHHVVEQPRAVEYVDAEVEVIRELPAGQTFDEETS